MPDVALGIPLYRSAPFLPELFERLRSLRPAPADLVFLDDASPDDSAERVRAFLAEPGWTSRGRLVRHAANAGIAAAYNRLAREAMGEWVHILDADDYPAEPDFYARVAPHLAAGNDLVVTALRSNSRLLRLGAPVAALVPRRPPPWLPLLGSVATRSGVLYRRERLLANPFIDPAFPGSDVLHLLALREAGPCSWVPEAHVHYRVHPTASSTTRREDDAYRRGLAGFGFAARTAHRLDLAARRIGQRLARGPR